MKKFFDTGTLVVIIITFLLFVVALFTRGFTHDLLLEAGVFLVSVKLIMMAYKTNMFYNSISVDLNKIIRMLEGNDGRDSFDRK